MHSDITFSILVPIYNEQESLPVFLYRLSRVLDSWNQRTEVLFIDDASSDASAVHLERFCSTHSRSRLLIHRVTRGRGNAILTAVDRAQGEILVTIDADLENPPEAIPMVVNKIQPGVSCVTGFRKGRGRKDFRSKVSWLYNCLMRLLTGLSLHDCNCGLKAFRRSVLMQPAIWTWLEKDGDYFRFLVYLFSRRGHRTSECAIPFTHRSHGKSRYNWKRYLKAILDLIRLLISDYFK